MEIRKYMNAREALTGMSEELIRLMAEKGEGVFNLALSGGETAKLMFTLWCEEYKDKIEWHNLRFFWVDERCVPLSDPESNCGNAIQYLFQPLGIPDKHIHRIKGEAIPDNEAERYSEEVEDVLPLVEFHPRFDCIILGIGNDQHTASIFPDNMSLLTDARSYVVSKNPYTGQQRITMTGSLILNNVPILIPVVGSGKAEMLRNLEANYLRGHDTPAAYVLSHAVSAVLFAAV